MLAIRNWLLIGMVVLLLGVTCSVEECWLGPGCSDVGFDEAFLNSLQGEIVYSAVDEERSRNIYKISANGENKTLLHSEYGNAEHPMWSEDGSKIYFTALKDGKRRKFVMDADGSNVEVVEHEEPHRGRFRSRASDIIVMRGSVYWEDEQGELHQVYDHHNYNGKSNPGAYEASWSPDKKYIIFDYCGYITVANREGTSVTNITNGIEPDWKY